MLCKGNEIMLAPLSTPTESLTSLHSEAPFTNLM